MNGLLAGIVDLLRALALLLRHPKLIGLALIPSLAAFVLSGVAVYFSFDYADEFLKWMNVELDDGWISQVMVTGGGLFTSILAVVIMPWLIMLVGFPLCEPLVAQADVLLGGEEVESSMISGVGQGIMVSIGVAILGLGGAVVSLLFGWVPLFGQILVAFYVVFWGPLILCFDLCDATFSRRFYPFSKRFQLLRSDWVSTISVGFVAMILIAPPFFNLLGLPVAVLMGTLHAHRLQKNAHPN